MLAIGSFGNNVYVFWEDTDPAPYAILMRKSSDEGHTFGIKKIINSAGVFPLVEVSSDNKVHLSWTEWKSYPNEIDFLYERSLNQGTSFSCSTKLKASTSQTRCSVDIQRWSRVYLLAKLRTVRRRISE